MIPSSLLILAWLLWQATRCLLANIKLFSCFCFKVSTEFISTQFVFGFLGFNGTFDIIKINKSCNTDVGILLGQYFNPFNLTKPRDEFQCKITDQDSLLNVY